MNYPIGGFGQSYYYNPGLDTSTGHGVGLRRDAQARYCPHTGVTDHGTSARANVREAAWDAVGAIPVVGGVANAARGLFNCVKGLFTGNGAAMKDGVKQMFKGALYSIPGYGSVIAGANCAKNVIDAGIHGGASAQQNMRFGGYENQRRMVAGMGYGNMGMGLGLASPYAGGYGGGYGGGFNAGYQRW